MAEDEQIEEQDAESGEQEDTEGGKRNGKSALSRVLSKDILIPAAATAATAAAAGLAAKKGPDLKAKLQGEAEDTAQDLGKQGAEGAKQAISDSPVGKVAGGISKVVPGMGGGKGGKKKTRRLPIQRWTDVAVPVEQAYEAWTKFEDFPKFMHRVLSVKQQDDQTLDWQEKIWFSTRQWQGEITEQRENDRIAWKTVSGTSHSGVVSFHRLDDNLTRVLVTVDFQPSGMLEKMASGLRFAKRAVQADLARFKAYVELEDLEGLEYSAKPEEMSQTRQDEDKGDDEQDEQDEQDEGGNEPKAEDQNGSEDGDGANPEEREAERQEREQRRKQRREAVGSR